MDFLKHQIKEIMMVCIILLLFLIIFYLYQLPYEGYILAASIVLFVGIIKWGINYVNYKKESDLREQYEELQYELKQTKNFHLDYQQELESYFLTWIHQMKTPITASKLLLENPDEAVIQKVRQEVIQIENYTNLALSYLKLMNPTTDMDFAHVKLDDLIKPILKQYSIQFIHYKTKLHYETINDEVLTDARWTSIMIEQIMNNALKYARGKDIWITFDGDKNRLTIRDNGIGISEMDLPKIFDRGYSGFNGRLNDKSSGLGLFISRKIAARLNHSIIVESQQGEGTSMHIDFPKHQLNL